MRIHMIVKGSYETPLADGGVNGGHVNPLNL